MVDAYGELDVPKNKVTVLVVDEGRDVAVRVVFGVHLALVLALAEVKVDGLIVKPELLEHDHYLPLDTCRRDTCRHRPSR